MPKPSLSALREVKRAVGAFPPWERVKQIAAVKVPLDTIENERRAGSYGFIAAKMIKLEMSWTKARQFADCVRIGGINVGVVDRPVVETVTDALGAPRVRSVENGFQKIRRIRRIRPGPSIAPDLILPTERVGNRAGAIPSVKADFQSPRK